MRAGERGACEGEGRGKGRKRAVSALPALLALLALLRLGPGPAVAAPAEPALILGNGLTLVLRPVPGAADVALALFLKVGEHHEPAGRSGLAHLCEHVLVTAAAGGVPARSAEALAARYPKGHSAQTVDRTTFVGWVAPAARLEEELGELAARLSALEVTEGDLAREKPRVLAEVAHMFDRVPGLAAYNRARERALRNRAGGRRAGLPEHVRSLTLEEVRAFASRHYRARNAVLAVVGGFEPEALRTLATRLLGPLPAGERPVELPAPATVGAAPVDLLDVEDAPSGVEGRVCVAYPAPQPGAAGYAAFLTLVARLLPLGAPSPGDFPPPIAFAPLDEPGALYVSSPLTPGQAPEDAVAAVHERVRRRVMEPWSARDAVKVLAVYGPMLGLTPIPDAIAAQNPYVVALGLAFRAAYGLDPAALRRELRALEEADLPAVAARLFDPLAAGAAVVRVLR